MSSWVAAAVVLFLLFVFFAILTVVGIVMILRSRRRAAPNLDDTASAPGSQAQTPSRSEPTAAPAPETAPPDATVAVAAPSMRPRQLHCTAGANVGQIIEITGDGIYIGRDAALSQLVIADSRVSKRHVWVGLRNGEVVAIDQGSTNGTYVNDPASPRIHEQRLSSGDVLIVSNDVARFRAV